MTSPQNESAGSSQLGRSASDLGQQAKETAGRIADQQISEKKESATGFGAVISPTTVNCGNCRFTAVWYFSQNGRST